MTIGLVGSTGFVGSVIAGQRQIESGFHRPDIALIRGRAFTRLYVAGAPAQKWLANSDPDGDERNVGTLIEHLRQVQAETVVLVSTIDVYPDPVGVDEGVSVAPEDHEQAYGRNRLRLEKAVEEHFPRVLVVRLPGLFGPGLRKNLVYDLLHGREEFAHRDSRFQFYDMRRFCDDVDTALAAGLQLVNFATAPVVAHQVGEAVFGRELSRVEGAPVLYDMRTVHAELYGGDVSSGYMQSADDVLAAMSNFVAQERRRS